MTVPAPIPSAVTGRAFYEMSCAPCHGPAGEGGRVSDTVHAPAIAGAGHEAVARVRDPAAHLPAFSSALLPDDALDGLTTYVHEVLGAPPPRPAPHIGPEAVGPLMIGVYVWAALLSFAVLLRLLFREGRN